MLLSEIFEQLSYGELAQLNLNGASDTPGISDANYSRVIASVNMGLTELHKRFLLKEREIELVVTPGMTMYSLASLNDLIKVERIYAFVEDEFVELDLNNTAQAYNLPEYGARTTDYETLFISPDLKATVLKVIYRATHPQIVKEVGYFDPADVTVSLPYTHLEALLYYVASRIHNPIGMNQQFHDGNNFAAKFEQACLQLMDQSLKVDQHLDNCRLVRNGWA